MCIFTIGAATRFSAARTAMLRSTLLQRERCLPLRSKAPCTSQAKRPKRKVTAEASMERSLPASGRQGWPCVRQTNCWTKKALQLAISIFKGENHVESQIGNECHLDAQ